MSSTPSASLLAALFVARSRLNLRILLAGLAGGLCVLAFAPFPFFPLAFVSLAFFYGILDGAKTRDGFWLGWGFGIGLMGFGIPWIRISLNQYGNMEPWLAYFLTGLLVVVMGLYYGIAGAITRSVTASRQTAPGWRGPLLVFPAVWVLAEWLRGWLFTGFPWLAIGYTQTDSPLVGLAPVAGVYGVGLVAALCAGLLWVLVTRSGRARYTAMSCLILIWLAGAALDRVEWTTPDGKTLQATVVQANVPQSLKWDPEALVPTLRTYLELTRENWHSDLIVWPETAIPEYLHQVREPLIEPLAREAREQGTELVIGIPVLDFENSVYFNGLLSIGSREDIYHKRHLVPFGEFIPFKDILGPIARAFEVPMSDFSSGATGRSLLQVGAYQVGASICYEDVFPAEVIDALPEAAYLINVSNDAWFGDSLAPHQHLQMARMRAQETGRWLVRSTNTGISAIIDHRGQVMGTVPAFERGTFTTRMQPRRGGTPFVYLGNGLVIGVALSMLLAAFLPARQAAGVR